MTDDRIQTRHPDPARQAPRIPRWKYDAVRSALLDAVPAEDSGIAFADLPGAVRQSVGADTLERLGSVNWHVTVVKLDLEARGELERVPGARPQRVRRPVR